MTRLRSGGLDSVANYRGRRWLDSSLSGSVPRYEVAVRDLCYLIKQDSVQPSWWLEKSKAGNPDACKQKLLAGMPKSCRGSVFSGHFGVLGRSWCIEGDPGQFVVCL